VQLDRVVWQPVRAVPAGHFAPQDRPDDAVHVPDRQRRLDGLPALERGLAQIEQRRVVERLVQPVVLPDLAVAADAASVRLVRIAEVDAAPSAIAGRISILSAATISLTVRKRLPCSRTSCAIVPVDDMVGSPVNFPQLGVLRRDTHRAECRGGRRAS
jgi:hypothetical protein